MCWPPPSARTPNRASISATPASSSGTARMRWSIRITDLDASALAAACSDGSGELRGEIRPAPTTLEEPGASAVLGGSIWSRWSHAASAAALVSAISVLLLTACSSGPRLPHNVITYSKGVPPGITPATSPPTAPSVGWAPGGRIYVVTMGSSSCPNLPATVHADSPHHLIIKTKQLATGQ